MRPLQLILLSLTLLCPCPAARAATPAPQPVDTYPHPPIPAPARWPGALLLTTFFLFFAATAVGLIVRSQGIEDVAPAQSHDEPPGASHHHGPTGLRH